MEQGRDFDFSCSPTVSYPAMRMQLSAAAQKHQELFSVDVSNCFESDTISPEHRVWVEAPIERAQVPLAQEAGKGLLPRAVLARE